MIGVYNATVKRLLMTCAICCGSASAQAQSPRQIELTFDDGPGVVGELIDYTDGKYYLKTSVGIIAVPDDGVQCVGEACTLQRAPRSQANFIKLISLDGATALSGELLAVKDGMYVVSTSIGTVEIVVELVQCKGEGCIQAPPILQESEKN